MDKDPQTQCRFLSEEQAAKHVNLSTKTLQRYRTTGKGPLFIKVGARILYDLSDLDAFMESHKVSSTSAYAEA